MSIATSMRTSVTSTLTKLGSTVVIKPITVTQGSYGGYSSDTNTEGTNVSTIGVPSQYMVQRFSLFKAGDMTEGDLRIILKYDASIDINDKITFQSKDYKVLNKKSIILQDVVLAIAVNLKEIPS